MQLLKGGKKSQWMSNLPLPPIKIKQVRLITGPWLSEISVYVCVEKTDRGTEGEEEITIERGRRREAVSVIAATSWFNAFPIFDFAPRTGLCPSYFLHYSLWETVSYFIHCATLMYLVPLNVSTFITTLPLHCQTAKLQYKGFCMHS